jgi:hypothetical protein
VNHRCFLNRSFNFCVLLSSIMLSLNLQTQEALLEDIYCCSLRSRSYIIKVIHNGSLPERGTYFKRTHFFVFIFNINVDRNNVTASFYTTYEPFISHILNNLDNITILLSVHAVCTRINAIADSHLQDKVNYRLTKILLFLLVIKCYLEGDEHFFYIDIDQKTQYLENILQSSIVRQVFLPIVFI